MGNASGKAKQKPLLLGAVPNGVPGLFEVAFSTEDDHELATLAESRTPDAFHLPWKNGAYTEGEITLATRQVDYFFTADLSGCSLWYKFEGGKIRIRHEARTDKNSQTQHSLAGFKCVVDSNLNKDDVQLAVDEDTMMKTAQYYVVYALLDYDSKVIEFRSQLVRQKKNMLSRAEAYELVKVQSIPVSFPKS
ncbi:MAG TPA: hypothetical protein VK447_21210 [Myxococcaceae bacterium]|nr:hypothetical protein [Myxococcaceae bacterium]